MVFSLGVIPVAVHDSAIDGRPPACMKSRIARRASAAGIR